MKRILKLTESDLNRIVKRVIVETQESKKKEEIILKQLIVSILKITQEYKL